MCSHGWAGVLVCYAQTARRGVGLPCTTVCIWLLTPLIDELGIFSPLHIAIVKLISFRQYA
jgi:hypothetical protein